MDDDRARSIPARSAAAASPGRCPTKPTARPSTGSSWTSSASAIFKDDSRAAYVEIIDKLAARGCDAVALVCTEIPLLITPEVSPLPILDSTRLLATAAVEVALGERKLPTWRGGRVLN